MDSLYQMRDARFGLRAGSSKNQIRDKISMDLQRGFYFAWISLEFEVTLCVIGILFYFRWFVSLLTDIFGNHRSLSSFWDAS